MFEVYLPPAAKIEVVLTVFAFLLIAFHLICVWPRNLSKKSWKKVDYIWLAFATVGLLGASSVVRNYIVRQELSYSEERIELLYKTFRSVLELNARDNGYVCRVFVKTKFSPSEPEFSEINNEFQRACDWLKKKNASFDSKVPNAASEPSAWVTIDPAVENVSLQEVMNGLSDQYSYYNDAVKTHRQLLSEMKPTEIEIWFSLIGPWLLAFALALRIAKVSGELRYER